MSIKLYLIVLSVAASAVAQRFAPPPPPRNNFGPPPPPPPQGMTNFKEWWAFVALLL